MNSKAHCKPAVLRKHFAYERFERGAPSPVAPTDEGPSCTSTEIRVLVAGAVRCLECEECRSTEERELLRAVEVRSERYLKLREKAK